MGSEQHWTVNRQTSYFNPSAARTYLYYNTFLCTLNGIWDLKKHFACNNGNVAVSQRGKCEVCAILKVASEVTFEKTTLKVQIRILNSPCQPFIYIKSNHTEFIYIYTHIYTYNFRYIMTYFYNIWQYVICYRTIKYALSLLYCFISYWCMYHSFNRILLWLFLLGYLQELKCASTRQKNKLVWTFEVDFTSFPVSWAFFGTVDYALVQLLHHSMNRHAETSSALTMGVQLLYDS